MTDPSGRSLLSMAEEVSRLTGLYSPGRPAFSALARAESALKEAARELDAARSAYGPPLSRQGR